MAGLSIAHAFNTIHPNLAQILTTADPPRRTLFPRQRSSAKLSMLLGAHVSISGGFVEAAKAGKYIGCEAIQIFSRSPRTLRRPRPIAPEDVQALWDGMKKAGIVGIATHGNYLITSARQPPACESSRAPRSSRRS